LIDEDLDLNIELWTFCKKHKVGSLWGYWFFHFLLDKIWWKESSQYVIHNVKFKVQKFELDLFLLWVMGKGVP
jgi:hypothetical protein